MKWIGAFLLVSTTTWIGFDMSSRLGKRTNEIRQFILSLQMIEAEMAYSQLTLQQIFRSISNKVDYPINRFYSRLADQLKKAVSDFPSIWEDELDQLIQISALKKKEQEIIKQFGHNLGLYTFIQQQKHITLAIHHLESELDEAIEQRGKYEKMMRSLGILIGLFIVLLLV